MHAVEQGKDRDNFVGVGHFRQKIKVGAVCVARRWRVSSSTSRSERVACGSVRGSRKKFRRRTIIVQQFHSLRFSLIKASP